MYQICVYIYIYREREIYIILCNYSLRSESGVPRPSMRVPLPTQPSAEIAIRVLCWGNSFVSSKLLFGF